MLAISHVSGKTPWLSENLKIWAIGNVMNPRTIELCELKCYQTQELLLNLATLLLRLYLFS